MERKKPRNMHVVSHDGRWVVRGEGSSRITSVHKTQRDAIDVARKIAQNEKGELVIHLRDGRIRERDSFGSGPLPPKSPPKVLFPTVISTKSRRVIRNAIKELKRESKTPQLSREEQD